MALHPDVERLIVLVAEVQVERALREQKESDPASESQPGRSHDELMNTTTVRRGRRAVDPPNNREGAR